MKYAPLNELCTIQSGGTPSRSNTNYWNSPEIPWVKISDIKGKHITETEEYISNEGLSNSSAKIFPSGTILYTIFATLGEVGILDIDAATNQAIAGLTINSNKIKRDYLYYYLQSIKRQVTNMGRGVAQNNINIGILKQLEVPLYPPNIQSEIVCKLTYVEQLMSNRKQALTTLDTLVKSRFVEMFGDPLTNPLKWEVKSVIDLCDCMVPGRDKPKSFTGATPWITIDDLNPLSVTKKSKKSLGLTDEEIEEVNRKKVPANSVLMSCVGNLGICSIAGNELIINQQLHSFQCDPNVNPYYLMYSLSWQKAYMEAMATKTTVLYMNKSVCNSIPIMEVPVNLQNKFADFVKQTDKSKLAVQQSIDTLQTLKDKLMQDYFG